MDVEILGIGNFDVVIKDCDEHTALKAIEASNTPRVRAAFQTALDAAKATYENGARFTFVESPLGVEMYDASGVIQSMLRKYKRRGQEFWQGYLRVSGESVRRNDLATLKASIIEKLVNHEKRSTTLEGLL